MNFINELVSKSNYKQYLERMTNSVFQSSKGLIPEYAAGKTLDVGCGSGVLLDMLEKKNIKAEGIDVNTEAVKTCIEKGFNAKNIALENVTEKYDTVIFSSVLHEVSSYAQENRFGTKPIEKALQDAKKVLNKDGKIIIRDGIRGKKSSGYLIAKDIETTQAFERFMEESPIFEDIYTRELYQISGNRIMAPQWILKEFIFTYTWGQESWDREIKEQFGILSKKKWKKILKDNGFEILTFTVSGEEYEKYAENLFASDEMLKEILSKCTVLIVAKVKDSL